MAEKISPQDVIARYDKLNDIWPDGDKWHAYTGKIIHDTVKQWVCARNRPNDRILNIGSGGSSYGLTGFSITHADLCTRNLPVGESTICNAENLPFADGIFDLTICVGSVLNYCDALVAITEMARVTSPGGTLILEFEKSENLEYIGSKAFRASAGVVTTFYAGEKERIWVYSEAYITSLLATVDLVPERRHPIHVISSALLPVFPNQIAARFAVLDQIAGRIPVCSRYASNVMLQCVRRF